MNIEEILTRADVTQSVYYSDLYKENIRETISRSDSPLTRKEALCIRGMLTTSGETRRIIFTPKPQ